MKILNFNEGWKYSKGTGVVLADLGKPQQKALTVTLPHDAVIHTPHNEQSPNGARTGFYDSFGMNYEKKFTVIDTDNKVYYLAFDGVYCNAFVTVNDCMAGKCHNGYVPFTFDITPYIVEGENTVKVIIKNDLQTARWYSGGGIYRDVKLLVANAIHILPDGVKIATEFIGGDYAVVRVNTQFTNVSLHKEKLILKTEICSLNGEKVTEHKQYYSTLGHDGTRFRTRLTVKSPRLWSAETPELYICKSCLIGENGETIDECENVFGIRTVTVDSERGLSINGKSVKLRGGCIHQDNGIIGAVSLRGAEERKIRKLKEAGYNAVRIAHNPAGKTLLDACDKLGILVMNEFTDMWTRPKVDYDYSLHFEENWETDLERMVACSYNHPCVIMYSIGNEIAEAGNRADIKFGEKITEKLRKSDDTRPTLNCVNTMLLVLNVIDEFVKKIQNSQDANSSLTPSAEAPKSKEINAVMNEKNPFLDWLKNSPEAAEHAKEAFSSVDIIGLNYGASLYENYVKENASNIIVGSETYPADLDFNWELVEKYPQVLGDFVWTAIDYIGEAGIGVVKYGKQDTYNIYSNDYCLTAGTGTLDLIGDRRPASYWREIIWGLRSQPYIAVRRPDKYGQQPVLSNWTWSDSYGSWNWHGFENKPVVVEVYSDGDEVELFINGKSAGRKKNGEEKKCVTVFDTVYHSGTVEAVSYRNGKEISRFCLKSGEGKRKLNLCADRTVKRGDVAFIEISVEHENGVTDILADDKISIEVKNGELLGFGSADSYSKENFYDTTRSAYFGRLLAAVRATQAGDIEVKVVSDFDIAKAVIKVIDR